MLYTISGAGRDFIMVLFVGGPKMVTYLDLQVVLHYGIPYTSSIIAFDPIQRLLALGTLFYSFYNCPRGGCANETSAVALSQVTLRNLRGTSTQPVAITLDCSQNKPCTGIVMVVV